MKKFSYISLGNRDKENNFPDQFWRLLVLYLSYAVLHTWDKHFISISFLIDEFIVVENTWFLAKWSHLFCLTTATMNDHQKGKVILTGYSHTFIIFESLESLGSWSWVEIEKAHAGKAGRPGADCLVPYCKHINVNYSQHTVIHLLVCQN